MKVKLPMSQKRREKKKRHGCLKNAKALVACVNNCTEDDAKILFPPLSRTVFTNLHKNKKKGSFGFLPSFVLMFFFLLSAGCQLAPFRRGCPFFCRDGTRQMERFRSGLQVQGTPTTCVCIFPKVLAVWALTLRVCQLSFYFFLREIF